MNRKVLTLLVLVTFLLLLGGCKKEETTNNTAATSGTETTGTAAMSTSTGGMDTSATTTGVAGGTVSNMEAADKDFVMKAAVAGMAEVAAGNMAAQKASSNDVKAFAQRMVTDHGKANDELKQLATNKGLALPADLDADHKKAADELSAKSGKDFDKAYMQQMVSDHEKAVGDFENASKNAKDADLKAWAAKTLPTLQDHLKMAKDVSGKVK